MSDKDDSFLDWQKSVLQSTDPILSPTAEQTRLFHRRVTTPLPAQPNGQHVGFRCWTDDGLYYCKDDQAGLFIRSTEWIATQLAHHLGIATAQCAIIETEDGQTYFGSRSPLSVADEVEVSRMLSLPATGELGQPLSWLGQYLAGLRVFDMFIDNPDRSVRNFILDRDGTFARLCAIDFASARLLMLPIDRFPVASEPTIFVGNILRKTHGSHADSANEMLDRIAAIPPSVVEHILKEIPEDWLPGDIRGKVNAFWSSGDLKARVACLREHLRNES
jgi:hypothetical protein